MSDVFRLHWKVIEFFALCYQTVPINQMHIIFCKKLSMIIIFFQHFWHLSQFCPVSSTFFRTKLEEIGFFHFFPGVPEEIGFFRKKPNPGSNKNPNFPVSFSLVSAETNLGNYRTLRGLQTANPEGLPSTTITRSRRYFREKYALNWWYHLY